jgi:hypothetical protein
LAAKTRKGFKKLKIEPSLRPVQCRSAPNIKIFRNVEKFRKNPDYSAVEKIRF